MRTVIFSNDHERSIKLALRTRINFLDRLYWQFRGEGVPDSECMSVRDEMDVAKQALALVEG
jgi:hypothetical protein